MTVPAAAFSVKNDQSPGNRPTRPNVSNATQAMIIAAHQTKRSIANRDHCQLEGIFIHAPSGKC
jgi:hypothetical protein